MKRRGQLKKLLRKYTLLLYPQSALCLLVFLLYIKTVAPTNLTTLTNLINTPRKTSPSPDHESPKNKLGENKRQVLTKPEQSPQRRQFTLTMSGGRNLRVNVQMSPDRKQLILLQGNQVRNVSVPRLKLMDSPSPEPVSPKVEKRVATPYRKGRKYKVSSAPAGSPVHRKSEFEELAEKPSTSPRIHRRFQSEIDHWREINARINAILDKKLVWIPESELLLNGVGKLKVKRDPRQEAARIKMALPKFINKKSKVRLFNMRVKLNSARRGSNVL